MFQMLDLLSKGRFHLSLYSLKPYGTNGMLTHFPKNFIFFFFFLIVVCKKLLLADKTSRGQHEVLPTLSLLDNR